jgi:hypothetical protein
VSQPAAEPFIKGGKGDGRPAAGGIEHRTAHRLDIQAGGGRQAAKFRGAPEPGRAPEFMTGPFP